MAGIEKVCEYSDEYPGLDMYRMKKNHIQICSKYRKQFRGADHILYICKPEQYIRIGKGLFTTVPDEGIIHRYDPPFDNIYEYIQYQYGNRCNFVLEYGFVLKVNNPNLYGRVKGMYCNFTKDLTTTKRKLKRMLRCRKLNIVYVDKSLYDFMTEQRNYFNTTKGKLK